MVHALLHTLEEYCEAISNPLSEKEVNVALNSALFGIFMSEIEPGFSQKVLDDAEALSPGMSEGLAYLLGKFTNAVESEHAGCKVDMAAEQTSMFPPPPVIGNGDGPSCAHTS